VNKLDHLADVLSAALRLPREALFVKRNPHTRSAREAFAYLAVVFAETQRNQTAEFLGLERTAVTDQVENFRRRLDGTEGADFEDADDELCAAIEKIGFALKSGDIDMSAFDDATLEQLRKLQAKSGGKDSRPYSKSELAALTRGDAIEPARRFTDKPDLNPSAVRGLPDDHPAMRENRTLFPSTVVEVTEDEPARLLVSGANNRKLGDVVAKGRFKGYALYGLSLEERATCPTDCSVRDICYGNGMQMARRHRIGDADVFYDRLGLEIAELLSEHEGLLVRLHVLGDFPSVEYVANWADLLEEWETLAVYGYTARRETAMDGDEIGDAIDAVRRRFPDRFRIRTSGGAVPLDDGLGGDWTFVIDHAPDQAKVGDVLICPAQTDATACCATCGLCWEPANKENAIAFIKHGPKSSALQAEAEMQAATPEPAAPTNDNRGVMRRVQAITLPKSAPRAKSATNAPELRWVQPTDLNIEGAYQRDLSARSLALVRKIVGSWDWAKFKPPICAERDGALVVVDGQHTAIAAATLGLDTIPVMLVRPHEIEGRASAFVAHNRDRLVMSPFQIFHASVTAGDEIAVAVSQAAARTGAVIPRAMPARGKGRPGQIIDIRDISRYAKADGIPHVERIFRIAVAAECAPLGVTATRALHLLLTEPYFGAVANMPDSRIANALKSVKDFEATARTIGETSGHGQVRAGAIMIAEACEIKEVAA